MLTNIIPTERTSNVSTNSRLILGSGNNGDYAAGMGVSYTIIPDVACRCAVLMLGAIHIQCAEALAGLLRQEVVAVSATTAVHEGSAAFHVRVEVPVSHSSSARTTLRFQLARCLCSSHIQLIVHQL